MVPLLTRPIPLPRIRPRRVWISRLLGLLGAGFAWPLLLWACAGGFSRLEADDYAVAASARHLGLWAAQWYWYNHWHGRFAMQLSLDTLGLAGPKAAGLLPPFFLLGWAAAAALTLRFGAARLGVFLPWHFSAPLAAAGVWTAIWLTPDAPQATWWASGLLTYLVPLVGLTLWPGLAALAAGRRSGTGSRRLWGQAGLGLLAFLIGGFSETATAVFLVWLTAAALGLAALPSCRSAALPAVLAGLAGAALAAAVMVHAPGNLIREAYCQPAPSVSFWWARTWRAASLFTELQFLADGTALAALGGVTLLASFGLSAPLPRSRLPLALALGLVAVPALSFLSILTCFGLTVYAASSSLPPRAELLPSALAALAVFSVAAAAGLALRALTEGASYRIRVMPALPAALLAAGCACCCLPDWSRAGQAGVSAMAAHARFCDRQNAFLQAASGHAVLLQGVPSPYAPLALGGDPASWPNRGVAAFYGLTLVEGGGETRLLTPAEEVQARRQSRIVPGLTPLVDGVPKRLHWLEAQQAPAAAFN